MIKALKLYTMIYALLLLFNYVKFQDYKFIYTLIIVIICAFIIETFYYIKNKLNK